MLGFRASLERKDVGLIFGALRFVVAVAPVVTLLVGGDNIASDGFATALALIPALLDCHDELLQRQAPLPWCPRR